MQRFHRLSGVAAIALTTLGLSACYPPPPGTVAFAPSGEPIALPPQPPPTYLVPPSGTTPPYPPTAAATPQPYGPTTLQGVAPSNAGTTFASLAPFGPPPPRVETPPPPPSPLAVWQPGHWSWSGGQYVWLPGQYVQRQAATANWVPGYWQQGPNGWTWIEGRWA
jgi:hypothetical protein